MKKLIPLPLLLAFACALLPPQPTHARMLSGVNAQAGTSYTFVAVDATRLTTFQNASAVAVTLPNPATLGFQQGYEFDAQNLGPGLVTITCTSCLIFTNGASGAATLLLSAGQGTLLFSSGVSYSVVSPGLGISGPTGAPVQLGDIPRFNVNGDNSWDAVNYAQRVTVVSPVQGVATGIPNVIGPLFSGANDTNNLCSCGTASDVNPTATTGFGTRYTSLSSASTNTVIGVRTGENGNQSQQGMLAFYRWTLTISFNTTTNARYWMGLGCWRGSGGLGNNGLGVLNSAGYASDTPNKTTLGFRFSAGTDTHWQAVSAVAGGSQTTTATGITPDTGIHTYEMTTNTTGTARNL